MILTDEQTKEFESAAKPLIEFLTNIAIHMLCVLSNMIALKFWRELVASGQKSLFLIKAPIQGLCWFIVFVKYLNT